MAVIRRHGCEAAIDVVSSGIPVTIKKTVENYINDIYTRLGLEQSLLMPRVSAAKWYWSRRDMIKHHYIFEVSELPVIIEVRREPAGNFSGRMVK